MASGTKPGNPSPERARTKNGEIWADGNVLIIKLSGTVESDEIEEVAKIGRAIGEKEKIKSCIIDITDVKYAPFGTRKTASGSLYGPAEKIAFVCSNPVSRIIGSFFLRRYKMAIPTKMFANEGGARKWFGEK